MLKTVDRVDPQFHADVLAGLAAPTPSIPARWLYDRRGSELFDDITRLPAYYPTRIETALLEQIAPELAKVLSPGSAIVEFGAGSAAKTPILLRAARPAAYVPIDISGDYLRDSAATVAAAFPLVDVMPVEGDFTQAVRLPGPIEGLEKIGFFPGSTIGNFVPRSATDLLRGFRAMLGTDALLLIGMDRVKPVRRLIEAYDDTDGVTASFNLNLIERINRELDGDIPVGAFRHEARWNELLARIEMHLVATRDVAFTVDGHPFSFAEGESIHTENSHKYGERAARLLLLAGGWTPQREWTDPSGDFAIILARAEPLRFAP
ncbi:MAG TPA: L-histidine N(alpha)-methyltransferase [Sphingomicrobium sp.]|nr:L-histidine N(alpha)-methyltransferase [Sphingomicrobium sp.]